MASSQTNGNNGATQPEAVTDQNYSIRCISRPVEGGTEKLCRINPLLLKALGIETEYVTTMPKQTAVPAQEMLAEETITLPPPE